MCFCLLYLNHRMPIFRFPFLPRSMLWRLFFFLFICILNHFSSLLFGIEVMKKVEFYLKFRLRHRFYLDENGVCCIPFKHRPTASFLSVKMCHNYIECLFGNNEIMHSSTSFVPFRIKCNDSVEHMLKPI